MRSSGPKRILQIFLWYSFLRIGYSVQSFMFHADEARLMRKLLDGYNKDARPFNPDSNITVIDMEMTLSQVISVNEKKEVVTTSLFMIHKWNDSRLTWNPSEYGGINVHRLTTDSIWVPRIILENSMDDDFDVSLSVDALVYADGQVEWMPPSLYKSFCRIEVELFPFDWQNCTMVFRSLTYEANEVQLTAKKGYIVIDKGTFQPNGEWDFIRKPIGHATTFRAGIPYSDVIFYITLRRRPQFYIMNLIVPCILMSMFSCFTFFLPSVSGEKMTLSVSVLLGETVFLFLIAQRMPETSLSIPLIGLYLIFSMGLVILCVIFSVIVCNLHFRSSTTHAMPRWAQTLVMGYLASFLKVERPPPSSPWQLALRRRQENAENSMKATRLEQTTWRAPSEMLFDKQAKRLGFRARHVQDRNGFTEVLHNSNGDLDPASIPTALLPAPKALKAAIDGVNFIARHVKEEEIKAQSQDDWGYFAMIMDRLFFLIYMSAFILGTVGFFLRVAAAYYPESDM